MIISVILDPIKGSIDIRQGIHRYQSYTKFFEVLDDFFTSEDYNLNKSTIIETMFNGSILNSYLIVSVGLNPKDKQFKRQL